MRDMNITVALQGVNTGELGVTRGLTIVTIVTTIVRGVTSHHSHHSGLIIIPSLPTPTHPLRIIIMSSE